jgi:hypothetical protein
MGSASRISTWPNASVRDERVEYRQNTRPDSGAPTNVTSVVQSRGPTSPSLEVFATTASGTLYHRGIDFQSAGWAANFDGAPPNVTFVTEAQDSDANRADQPQCPSTTHRVHPGAGNGHKVSQGGTATGFVWRSGGCICFILRHGDPTGGNKRRN